MWKVQYDGREVAAKVSKVPMSDSERARKASFPQLVVYINEFIDSHTDTDTEVLQGGRDMEGPSSSECPAIIRCDNGRKFVYDSIGVDAKREHQ